MAISAGTQLLGLITEGDRDSDSKERQLRKEIFHQAPAKWGNMSKEFLAIKRDPVDGYKYEWPVQRQDPMIGSITGCYSDSGLSSAIGDTQTADAETVYLKMAAADVPGMIPGKMLHLVQTNTGAQLNIQVALDGVRTVNGASSYVKCTTRATDTNKVLYMGASNWACTYSIMGHARVTGSGLPGTKFEEPVLRYNYTQISMEALEVTGTEVACKEYYNESLPQRQRAQMIERFMRGLDADIRFGERKLVTAQNTSYTVDGVTKTGPMRTAGGLLWCAKTFGPTHPVSGNPANVIDVASLTTIGDTDQDLSGQAWDELCFDMFTNLGLHFGTYATSDTLRCPIGNSGLANIQRALRNNSKVKVDIEPWAKDEWGFWVSKMHGFDITFEFVQDPVASLHPYYKNAMWIYEPSTVRIRPLRGRDLCYINDNPELLKQMAVESGHVWRDGATSGMVMESTLVVDNCDSLGFVYNLGSASA